MTKILRAALLALCTAAPAFAGPVTTIALSDRAALGSTTGPSGGIQFGATQINEAGQVLYKSYPGFTELNRYTPGTGVERMARTTDPAVGVPDRQIILPNGTTAGMALQQDGDVTFFAQLNGISNPNIFSLRSFYEARGAGAGISIAPVAVEKDFRDTSTQDLLDDGRPASPWIGFQDTPEVSEAGALLDIPVGAIFLGGPPPRPLGVYEGRTFTTLLAPGDVLRDRNGQPLKDINGTDLRVTAIAEGNEQINANGTVAAYVTTTDISGTALALVRIRPGEAPEVLARGRAAEFGAFDLNDAGDVAWTQAVETTGDTFGDVPSLLKTEGSDLVTVQTAVGPGLVGAPLDLNEAGDILVQNSLGLSVNGGPFLLPEGYRFFSIDGIDFNSGGVAAFSWSGQLPTDPGNLLRRGLGLLQAGAFEILLEVGDLIEVAPGDTRQISQLFVSNFDRVRRTDSRFFNDAGQLAFDAIFEPTSPGGPFTSGVFVYDTATTPAPVPLPAGAWLLLSGVGTLALRRRISG